MGCHIINLSSADRPSVLFYIYLPNCYVVYSRPLAGSQGKHQTERASAKITNFIMMNIVASGSIMPLLR